MPCCYEHTCFGDFCMTVLRNTRLFHFHSKYILFLIFLWCWNSQCFLFSFFFLLFFQSSEVLLLQHRTKSSSVSSWASCWESFCTTQVGSLQPGPSSNPPSGFAHSNALHSMYVHISFSSSFFLMIFSAFLQEFNTWFVARVNMWVTDTAVASGHNP